MARKAVVVGVDGSPASARAATFGWTLAQDLRVDCRLVYAVPDTWLSDYAGQPPMAPRRLMDEVVGLARARVGEALAGAVPQVLVERMDVRLGRAAVALRAAADEADAPYLVLGGKHHTALGRTLGGSTARDLVRTMDRPLLVVGEGSGGTAVHRVLAAIDLSSASRPTVAAARRLARVRNAELRVVCVVEPVRVPLTVPFSLDEREVGRRVAEVFGRMERTTAGTPPGEWLLRHGVAEDAIAAEAREWQADVIVVGSHGKGWVDRVLIGSTTERLLAALPTGLLVVPTGQRLLRRPMPAKVGVAARARTKRGVTV
jgi:nucleotide-binding universal stress UspA family protein